MLMLTDPPTIPDRLEERVTELELATAEVVARQLRGERVDRSEVQQLRGEVQRLREEVRSVRTEL